MRNSRAKLSRRTFVALCSLAVTVFAQLGPSSTAAAPKAEIANEARTLDKFVDDLFKLDRKTGELSKRASLNQAEFDSLKGSADDLKRRLAEVQNALRGVITKLKAAGEWDDIDSRVAGTISDASLRARFRQTSFKRELEELAANVANQSSEISDPVELLRRKVSARSRDSVFPSAGYALAWQAEPAAYHPEPAMFTSGLRCSLSKMRYGVVKLTGAATARA
ncbi:MAG TPA: hypothetical protein VFZ40_09550, partial [Pyrinomonadaceae bacterium]